ncbi:MAG: hypothetical protein L6R38_006545 [Xanthoria sp. 2 TBL-2021]|nr:MAG: hypothetical protein L6R38_006545 [Xanthoria sp. 2 TBL-2021]
MAVSGEFYWLYLLLLLVCALLSVLFLFYFNRVFASLISYAVRTYLWRQYHIYLDVQALQLSLLGGRCFFKGLRYHGQNETILINDGYITWRYWLRRFRDAECLGAASSGVRQGGEEEEEEQKRTTQPANKSSRSNLPCRIKIKVRGLEWFIYNRTPAYETAEKSHAANNRPSSPESASSPQNPGPKKDAQQPKAKGTYVGRGRQDVFSLERDEKLAEKEPSERASMGKTSSNSVQSSSTKETRQPTGTSEPLPAFVMLLPVKFECGKAAIVMGNRNTKSVLIAKSDTVHGHIDACQARAIDLYKQMFEFEFGHPVVELKVNHEFEDFHLPTGVTAKPDNTRHSSVKNQRCNGEDDRKTAAAEAVVAGGFIERCKRFLRSIPATKSDQKHPHLAVASQIPGHDQWLGLTRYLDDDENIAVEQERWRTIEYGRHSVIVDSPSINLNLFWDVPGLVPVLKESHDESRDMRDINGDVPPDWSVELRINGGLISYGPWADRLRTDLQPVFFPNFYKDAIPATQLSPGQRRVSTVFKLNVDVEQTITLLVPTRESSKDWKWKDDQTPKRQAPKRERWGKGHGKRRKKDDVDTLPTGRPYGWIDVEIQPDSTVTFTMDLVAGQNGYKNLLSLDIREPKMSSSVNHGMLLKAQTAVISCDLSYPLPWNAMRQWAIEIDSAGLELFMLRDHIFLFTDIVSDWTVGAPEDFYTFVSFLYRIKFQLADFQLHLNANDSNVINDPASMEENTFLTIWGQNLLACLELPLVSFRPARNEITFDIDAQDGGFKLSRPPWNTQHVFLNTTEVATMKDLKIDGGYDYCSSTSSALTDILRMNVHGVSPRVRLYGFLVRAFMSIKDNYFGDDIHFRTLEEYQEQIRQKDSVSSTRGAVAHQTRISNDLDVILSVTAVDAEGLLPSYLYSSESDVTLDIASLALDLRFTNYYMDLDMSFSPITIGHASFASSEWQDPVQVSEAQVFVDGVSIRGHRLFGLPPSEPTYVCNWDFDVGAITGECSVPFFKDLSSALRCFSYTFDDIENALPPLFPAEIHDVTILRARLQHVHIWLKINDAAVSLSTEPCSIEYNDLARSLFSERLHVYFPSIAVALVANSNVGTDRNGRTVQLQPCAFLESGLELSMLHRRKGYSTDRRLQQQHIVLHDARTLRTPWLIQGQEKSLSIDTNPQPKVAVPAMPYPAMPEPLKSLSGAIMTKNSIASSSLTGAASESYREATAPSSSHPKGDWVISETNRSEALQGREPDPKAYQSELIQTTGTRTSTNLPQYSRRSFSAEKTNAPLVSSHTQTNTVRTRSGVSSAYRAPYFRLHTTSLDLSDVPPRPGLKRPEMFRGHASLDNFTDAGSGELPVPQAQCERTSWLVNLGQGVRGLCRSQSMGIVASLSEELQIRDPQNLLDELQVNALGSLPASGQSPGNHEIITECRVTIPLLNLKLVDQFEDTSSATVRNVSSELKMIDCVITARDWNKVSPGMGSQAVPTLSTHVMLNEARLSMRIAGRETLLHQAVMHSCIREMSLWGCRAVESSVHMRFKDFETECGITAVDSLAILIQRAEKLAQNASHFQTLAEQKTARLRQLILSLAFDGQALPDPPFLTRASYVLRSANSHVRKSESWKIATRLRFVYHLLPAQTRAQANSQCKSTSPSYPSSARDDVTAVFRRMGIWDSNNDADENILLNEVFGKKITGDMETPKTLMLKASIKAGAVRLMIQPGITASKACFDNIAFEVELRQVPATVGNVLIIERSASVRLYFSESALTMNFNLLKLLEDFIRTLPNEKDGPPPRLQKPRPNETSTNSYYIHIIIVSDMNTITIDAINLRILYLCRPVNASVVVGKTTNELRPSTTFLICTHTATIELLSHSQIVSVGKVSRPSLFGNLDSQKTSEDTTCWHLASSCTDISFKVLEDPLHLLEIGDRIMLNEAASVIRLIDSMQKTPQRSPSPTTASTATALGRPHVALFLDSYLISYKVLPALSYRITGKIGRISVRPGLRLVSDVILDFDLKEHAHSFLGRVGDNVEMISELIIPPVNGRLTLGTTPGKTDISFQSTIEHISLDAIAVHALLATLNRSEIGELVTSVQHESSRLLHRHKPTASPTKTMSQPAPSPNIVLFDGYVTLVGLAIHTNTTKALQEASTSQLHFELGHVHIKGNNRGIRDGPPLPFPELFINLRGLQVYLAKSLNGQKTPCGDFTLGATLHATSKRNERQELARDYQLRSSQCQICIYTETTSVVLDVLDDLRESFRDIDMTNEVKGLQKLRRATLADLGTNVPSKSSKANEEEPTALFSAMYSLEMVGPRMIWKVGDSVPLSPGREAEDLVLSFKKIDLATRRDNAARLLILDFQLQMVPTSQLPTDRSLNSALLPEVVFNVAYMSNSTGRRLAFQAAGKSLDLRLTSHFIIPASNLRRSIAFAVNRVRNSTHTSGVASTKAEDQTQKWLKHKRLESLLIDADFAGAVVYVQGQTISDPQSFALEVLHGRRIPQQGRYGQFTQDDAGSSTTLRAPGVAVKVQYKDPGTGKTSLNAEVKVDASSNTLFPSIVPLVLQISSSVKEIVGEPNTQDQTPEPQISTSRLIDDEKLRAADPTAIFQNCTLNLGLRICKQDFSLSCHPIARVAAIAQIDNIYITVNTVQSSDHGQSFALSGSFTGFKASVQHVYSREPTGGFEVQAVTVSLMNSKHVGAANGISVITQISPMKVFVNAKQLQDFLLFREIWVPADVRKAAPASDPSPSSEPQAYIVQRYQQISSAGAFPWNATLSVAELDFRIDFGQSLGKSGFIISELWASSKKSSDWEQDLCVGLKHVILDSTGRMSGYVNFQGIQVRTTIRWPVIEEARSRAPMIQASVAFESVRIKAAFEYQAFAMADMASFKFLMYNVRDSRTAHSDRLVGVVETGTLRAFCTATSVAQGLALYQAFERLIQEKKVAYQASLRDIEKHLRRRSTTQLPKVSPGQGQNDVKNQVKDTLRLQTKVMVSIGAVDVGIFPSTFVDNQLFRLQALDASAQFAVAVEKNRLHSVLELALGQLQVALSGVVKPELRKSLGDISLEEVVASAINSRGGTILKVPKVVARMQTWQAPGSNDIDFIFRSSFQGKVDVGWNYSRIGFLRNMWNNHARALAARLGKPLPQSALQITTALDEDIEGGGSDASARKEKITAVVNVPQSKYHYTALEPPVIETPQLRDMGEATPPLEWIGLHRERLPNVTHQIVIISLLELAREVDDAYSRILGSS